MALSSYTVTPNLPTRLVQLRIFHGQIVQNCEVYIGRAQTQGGWGVGEAAFTQSDSPWKNPFKGHNAAKLFYDWIMSEPQTELREAGRVYLRGKILGCWCVDKGVFCHGEVWQYICDGLITPHLEAMFNESQQQAILTSVDPSTQLSQLHYRILGMLSGLFSGDAMGAPFEFAYKFKDLNHSMYTDLIKLPIRWRPQHTRNEDTQFCSLGQVTDDSEMAITLARHLIQRGGVVDSTQLVTDYMNWSNSNQPMQGRNTRELFNIKTLKGYQRRYTEHFGTAIWNQPGSAASKTVPLSNGTLMRCCSLAVLSPASREAAMWKDVWLSNPDPRVGLMERVYLHALNLALQGFNAAQIWNALGTEHTPATNQPGADLILEVQMGVQRPLTQIYANNQLVHGKGSIMTCLHVALYWLYQRALAVVGQRTYPSFGEIMRWIIQDHPESDTDTNAAVTGALIGALDGYERLTSQPDFHTNLTLILDTQTSSAIPRPLIYHPAQLYQLAQGLTQLWNR